MAGIFDRIAGASGADETELTAEPMALDDGMDGEQPAMSANIQVDERRTPQRVREAVQEMLKYGLLEESHKPNLYRSALTNIEVVDRILEPLDLAMGVDEVRGLVFVTVRQGEVAEQDDWSHPLVRRQRLNLEQSLLIAILRQHFIAYEQESGTGASQALVAVDELIPQLQVYLGELGSEAKERNRIITLLDQLKGHGLVSALDAHDRVIIRPIITHLANPENLQALVVWLREQVEGAVTPAAGGEEDEA
ncbi:TPA: DUF4194 domain-containing protein [Pseudomonas aeruginosa]|jgi:hypothetical protein|uniref:DUF4194 domain-containing protein n=2 Tax=Pseudomonas aeruginosa TaxID=287 RepID=A0A0H2ZL66_PSEAB|nr:MULTISPECIES: DUF4194 domain-containing protein [Pseudomonas]8DK1_E Chain E, JetB [Pseudomonas aeruginosa PA14]8DK1_F Chain F, JetB [Pseudomonas aeruginosa PA14]8DK1_G Chain G, JetB [Pseudomonas aeruginosa PA14]8DK1_H Chain H, JetB [Pseudomonas aeruginosa PA14]8DK2_F Chain F, JetB [Pseudomonas aeruginosa PA14]8DK2_G Chain G, JetB [Pseudomonas aeruginosa PA14]8DK2_H Chain H, JetB [Pseudomonas aeruginosa PA14]8DK2_I Chain I, JetB [Pseudomonas aeruginosa PA14]SAJ33912.1 Uncharacterised pro